ncbi:MAG TPA: zinc ribbon domain-containing protein [Gammaproteobacteria bacterium]|nr:zinc ribbon domain-containing protein [Gammaproteobacteria bacterium]
MDDLDRLAFRVARTVRTTYPHLLERGFTLSDLEERLAPYPETRREMAHGGPDGYEQTVLRLIAGERGYLAAEPALQEACRRALQMASPAVSIVRSWAGSTLTLRGSAFSLGNERTTDGSARNAVSPHERHSSGQRAQAHSAVPQQGDSLSVVELVSVSDAADDAPRAMQETLPVQRAEPCACHFCGGALPSGRSITYCPFCGIDLTVRHCPACSTELDRAWRFCVSCGRQSDDGADDAAVHDSGTRNTDVTSTGDPMRAGTAVDTSRPA